MVNAKGKSNKKLTELLIFLYLVIFPLGQIIRFSIELFGVSVPIHPTDVLVSFSIPLYFLTNLSQPRFFKHLSNFLIVLSFSFLLSTTFIEPVNLAIGFLYFLRLASYFLFFVVVYDFVRKQKKKKELLFNSLIGIGVAVAVLGWFQYFFYPDLRSLKILGWDDHLYRLVGTFLDPAFTSILLVFGFLATFGKFLKDKNKKFLITSLFFLLTVAFTYARAAYLALLAGVLFLVVLKNKSKEMLILIFAGLILLVLFLPRPSSEGVKLERMHSVVAKFENYQETLQIIGEYPLFGVGFNNICTIRQEKFDDIGYASHSCSGSDSSILLLIATTGVVGFSSFIYVGIKAIENLTKSFYREIFLASLVSLLVHSLFVNSLFYPWIMGYLAIFMAIVVKD